MNLHKYIPLELLILACSLFVLCMISPKSVTAQTNSPTVHSTAMKFDSTKKRPIPYPVMPSPQFRQAVSEGTRTAAGQPGASYWTNKTRYNFDVTLSPNSQMLRGHGSITYYNNSPDTLHQLVLHLRQNFYQKGNMRNRQAAITGGMEIARLAVNDQQLLESPDNNKSGYDIRGTLLEVQPPVSVAPGDSINLNLAWSFKVPPAGGSRIGQDGEVFYLGYWYPQMAVYDDVNGWYAQPYMGDGEFYMGYADYRVDITVPEGWLVGATGRLVNAESVLSPQTQDNLRKARTSDEIIQIVGKNERSAGQSTQSAEDGRLTWSFEAQNVRDFAFGTSAEYVWDAANADNRADHQTLVHSFYRPEYQSWHHGAKFARFAVEDLTETLLAYPWSHMTIMEGILGGGMEYPMITIIGSNKSKKGLFGTVYHEIAHMWFPMMVGSNEKRYTWMDEGLVTFLTNEGQKAYWSDADPWAPGKSSYYYIAGSGREVPSMRHGDRYPVYGPARGIASYSKPGLMLHTLRGVIGDSAFSQAFRSYAERWSYKHPYPYDLFNTFEKAAGRDLDWFWTSTLYNTWTLDQAISRVRTEKTPIEITIRDQSLMPMPVTIRCTYKNRESAQSSVSVSHWLKGHRSATVRCPTGDLLKVELDPHQYLPDIDRSNNVWKVKH